MNNDILQDGTVVKPPTPTAELLALSDIDQIALEVARRFTQDTEWQRRANLQVAVIDAIKRARPSLSAQAVGEDALVDELSVGGRVEFTELQFRHFLRRVVATPPQPADGGDTTKESR